MRMRRTGAVVVVAVVSPVGAGLLAAVVLDELLPHPVMLRANASTLTTQTMGFRRSMILLTCRNLISCVMAVARPEARP
jgi:hypothetical protein